MNIERNVTMMPNSPPAYDKISSIFPIDLSIFMVVEEIAK
jgi:hypothetical protein